MAVSGGTTTAYSLSMQDGTARAVHTTFPRSKCTPPDVAVDALRHWTPGSKSPVVQGSDMATFWRLWEGGAD